METYIYSQKIVGTELIVSIDSHEQTKADLAFADILILGKSFESEFSRFLSDSPLSILNSKKELEVSDRFISVFKLAQQLYTETNKIFNPLVQVENLGYKKDFSESESFSNIVEDEYSTDLNKITISDNTITLQKNQNLDFGGFLKGLFCDYAKQNITEFDNAIINLGGDIVVVGNTTLDIYNPVTQKNDSTINLTNTNIATSGTYKRNWEIDGKTYNHIIEPHSKQSVESDLCSVSIISEHGYIADAYATTSFILGLEKAVEFLDEKNIDYVLITTSGKIITNTN